MSEFSAYCALPDGLYVARDGKLWKMDAKYIPPKNSKVIWIGGKPSNADHIRAMTDEELVFFLWWFADGSGKTKDQWRDWLKQECDK